MESRVTTRMSSRLGPLHTCGVSFIEITHKACTKTQDFNGPLGSMTKKIASVTSSASPLVYALQCQLLAVLGFIDAHILGLENAAEAIFPPSGIVFDKVDDLVQIAETLPGKFDDAVDKLPTIIHQVPLLDWAVACAISWLNFWLSILTQWGAETTKEKEIVIDVSCNELSAAQEADNLIDSPNHCSNEAKEGLSPISGTSDAENETVSPKTMKGSYKDALEKDTKVTYKDVLEKGTKENIQNKENGTKENIKKSGVCNTESTDEGEKKKIDKEEGGDLKIRSSSSSKEDTGKGGVNVSIEEKGDGAKEETKMSGATKMDQISEEDPILALFESAWLMSPVEKGKGSSVSHSISYQW